MKNDVQNEGFYEISHTADVSLKVIGPTLESLFLYAAKGFYSLVEVVADNRKKEHYEIDLFEINNESLLVSFLSELIFFLEKSVFMSEIEVCIHDSKLNASMIGSPVISMQHEIKAVTYNDLEINLIDGMYATTIVFDI